MSTVHTHTHTQTRKKKICTDDIYEAVTSEFPSKIGEIDRNTVTPKRMYTRMYVVVDTTSWVPCTYTHTYIFIDTHVSSLEYQWDLTCVYISICVRVCTWHTCSIYNYIHTCINTYKYRAEPSEFFKSNKGGRRKYSPTPKITYTHMYAHTDITRVHSTYTRTLDMYTHSKSHI